MDEQRTEEWFDARLGKATASRYADILNVLKNGQPGAMHQNYKAQLVIERLTGQNTEHFTNSAMEWGIECEPLAVEAYELETGNVTTDCGFLQHAELEAGASPDKLIDEDGGLEIKCPNTATHISYLRDGKLPSQYRAQVQGGMWISGRKWWDFVSFDPRMPENARMFIVRVERDDKYISELEGAVVKFLLAVEDDIEFVQKFQLKTEAK